MDKTSLAKDNEVQNAAEEVDGDNNSGGGDEDDFEDTGNCKRFKRN